MTANVKCIVEQRGQTFCKTNAAYRLALIHYSCSSNLQSELWITHANTAITLSQIKTIIFRYHYVTEKHHFCWN